MYGEVEYYFAHEYIHKNINQVRIFAYIEGCQKSLNTFWLIKKLKIL